MGRLLRRWFAVVKAVLISRSAQPPTEPVVWFLAGLTVREVAYYHTTGPDWPGRVRQVEEALRAHMRQQAALIAELESEPDEF